VIDGGRAYAKGGRLVARSSDDAPLGVVSDRDGVPTFNRSATHVSKPCSCRIAEQTSSTLSFGSRRFCFSDPRATSLLKNLITTEKRLSHEKFYTPEYIDTYENILVTSNDLTGAIHVEQGDRRVCVFKAHPGWVTPHPTNAREWVPKLIERNGKIISIFKAMMDDLEVGGYGRLMYDIMAEDLTDFTVGDFPRTEARAQQSLGSLSIELQFYYNVLAERTLSVLRP
jgi:hypothetical protein